MSDVFASAIDLEAAATRPFALVAEPTAPAVIAVCAAFRTGAVLAPLHPALSQSELAEALTRLEPVTVIVEAAANEIARSAVASAGIDAAVVPLPALEHLDGAASRRLLKGSAGDVSVEGAARTERGGEVSLGPRETDPHGAGRSAAAAVLWTSGTTGTPRGIVISRGGLEASADAVAARLSLSPADRWAASLSVAHVGGLALIHRAGRTGATVVATGRFDAGALGQRIDRGEVTHMSVVPTMLRRLLDARSDRPAPETLEVVLVGGAACPPELLRRAITARFPVALTYGSSETTSQVATASPARVRRKPGTVGPPLPGVEVRVAGTQDEPGEIAVRGRIVAPALWGGGAVGGVGGWYRTGDLGYLDSEGDLWVTGRLGERIITGGVNVDPGEVEAALRGVEGVEDAAVVGLPDARWGEAVCAAVVPSAGSELAAAPDAAAFRASLRTRLSGPKRPRHVCFLEAIPLTASGKVDRAAVRDRFLDED